MMISAKQLIELVEHSQTTAKVYDAAGNEEVIDYLDGRRFREHLNDLVEQSPPVVFGNLLGLTVKEALVALGERTPAAKSRYGVDHIVQPFANSSDAWTIPLLRALLGWEYPKKTLIVFCRRDGLFFGPLRISNIIDYLP